MSSPSNKVTILLADEDALRREGLAAVLSGRAEFEVVAGVADGANAIQAIRDQRPDVAVVDLNLPGIHGIELVRRVRSESLHTKVVIMAGTADDEIVREVVRAGGDGYVLKNGPARHLLDAISYVRDGGQYFSPQLGRDGRDRHLLEEPPRHYAAAPAAAEPDIDDEEAADAHPSRSSRAPRPRLRPAARRAAAPLRERIRDAAGGGDMGDHDYEIMSKMADGIRPILDRLDEIDGRVAMMEVGDAPVPDSPRDWLSHEIADTLGPRGDLTVSRNAAELEARLPEMIEEAVTKRFNQMANNLQQEIEETHVRTLEAFVKNIQVKLVQRVSALEQDMSKQADAMHQLREYSQRTEDNLSRLITGVDKLAQDLPKRLAAASTMPPAAGATQHTGPAPAAKAAAPKVTRSSRRKLKRIWLGIGIVSILGLSAWGITAMFFGSPKPATVNAGQLDAVRDSTKLTPPAATADIKTKMEAAQQYADANDYPMAEDLYNQVLHADPKNIDAIKGLASVQYREDKIDEATKTLDRLPK